MTLEELKAQAKQKAQSGAIPTNPHLYHLSENDLIPATAKDWIPLLTSAPELLTRVIDLNALGYSASPQAALEVALADYLVEYLDSTNPHGDKDNIP